MPIRERTTIISSILALRHGTDDRSVSSPESLLPNTLFKSPKCRAKEENGWKNGAGRNARISGGVFYAYNTNGSRSGSRARSSRLPCMFVGNVNEMIKPKRAVPA